MLIKCSNRTSEKCDGEFVLTIYDTCYFLYENDNIYKISEMNSFCQKKNQTEVDLSSKYPIFVYTFLWDIVFPINNNSYILPWNYFSKKFSFQFFSL